MSGAAAENVIDIAGYSLAYRTANGPFQALRDVSLAIPKGRTLGLVGESGSGKTSLAWAIMRYLPANAREAGGSIRLSGEELTTKSPAEIADIRGRRISMVFQDPSASLNPAIRMGEQIAEVLMRHQKLGRRQALADGEALLARTGIARPAELMTRYPHQASGGEKQRVVLATAFACNPECIIFDEPTTALDVITARQILDLFARLRDETGVSALYISHDLALVSRVAHDVAVIHQGAIVETGAPRALFTAPQQDYTRALLAAVPRPQTRLVNSRVDAGAAPLLSAEAVDVRFGQPTFLQRIFEPKLRPFDALKRVGIDVRRGEIVGVVGESGSGKSTLARVIAGLQDFKGTVTFGKRAFEGRRAYDKAYRRDVQIIFQHPDSSLNPRQRVRTILARPLKLYDLCRPVEIDQRIVELLHQVLLPAEFADRYPHQLSGGEKQRVAIARAFAAEPKLVICDEITSSLDVSVQSAVARLLVDLQTRTGAACLFITHDLNLIRQLAHRIAVMRHGERVDLFETAAIAAAERHPYTRDLVSAIPAPPGS
jgi:peptide/nickel transport system ATP-binding protein